MALWDTADLLTRCKLHARRPATDASMPDATWYSFLTEAQAEVFSDLFTRYPDLQYSAPALLTSSDGGKTYGFGTEVVPATITYTAVGDGAWTANNTPARTAQALIAADGTALDYLVSTIIGGGTNTFYSRAVVFTGNGQKTIRFRIARSSAYGLHGVALYDTTNLAYAMYANIDYSGTTPVVTASSFGGRAAGTILSVTDMNDGTFEVVARSNGILASHTNTLFVYVGLATSPAVVGFYIGNVRLSDGSGDAIRPMGHAEIYPSLAAIPSSPLLPGSDFVVEGSLIRIAGNRSQAFASGPYARFVARPDTALGLGVDPTLFPKNARMLLVWKALEAWASRPGSGASPNYFMAKYQAAREAMWIELATEYNKQAGSSAMGSWWTGADLMRAGLVL